MTDYVEMSALPLKSVTASSSWSLADTELIRGVNNNSVFSSYTAKRKTLFGGDGGSRRRRRRLFFFRKTQELRAVSWDVFWISIVTAVLSLAGIVSAITVMIFQPTTWTYLAFVFPLLTGPVILVQRGNLHLSSSFDQVSNKLRQEVNDLVLERGELQANNDRLEHNFARLASVEDRLQELVIREQRSKNNVRELIQTHKQLQIQIIQAQKRRELQDLFSIVLKSDKNEDGRVSQDELNELMHRLKAFAQHHELFFDETAIHRALTRRQEAFQSSHCTISLFNLLQMSLCGENERQSFVNEETSREIIQGIDDEAAATAAVKATLPRVTPTGLVFSPSKDCNEGNLVNPIVTKSVAYQQDDLMQLSSVASGPAFNPGLQVSRSSTEKDLPSSSNSSPPLVCCK